MENTNTSKAIRSILEQGQAVTVKQVLETLQSEHNINAEYRPVFGTLRRIANGAGKGTFQGLKKAEKVEAAPKAKKAKKVKVQEEVTEVVEATIAVEEAPVKKAAKRRKK